MKRGVGRAGGVVLPKEIRGPRPLAPVINDDCPPGIDQHVYDIHINPLQVT